MFVTTHTTWNLPFGKSEREEEDIITLHEILGKAVEVVFSTGQKRVVLPPGRYEMELVHNPKDYTRSPWLVIKGTLVGSAEGWWRSWSEMKNSDYIIDIEE